MQMLHSLCESILFSRHFQTKNIGGTWCVKSGEEQKSRKYDVLIFHFGLNTPTSEQVSHKIHIFFLCTLFTQNSSCRSIASSVFSLVLEMRVPHASVQSTFLLRRYLFLASLPLSSFLVLPFAVAVKPKVNVFLALSSFSQQSVNTNANK